MKSKALLFLLICIIATTAFFCKRPNITEDSKSDGNSETVARAVTNKNFAGVYLLMSNSQDFNANQADLIAGRSAYCDGVTIRLWWNDIESTQGVYDFSKLRTVIQKIQSHNPNALMNIAIISNYVPPYIAAITPNWKVPGSGSRGGNGSVVTVPYPWNDALQQSWRNLWNALGNFQVADRNAGGNNVALKNHSAVGSIVASVPGWGWIRDRTTELQNPDLTPFYNIDGYSPDKLIGAVRSSLNSVTVNFPQNKVCIGFFNIDDPLPGIRVDRQIANMMVQEFPKVGAFMESLMGFSPTYKVDLPAVMLFESSTLPLAQRPTSYFQACGIWITGGICEFFPDDRYAGNGIMFAANRIYVNTVEIYQDDITTGNATAISNLTTAHNYVRTKYNNPAICGAGASYTFTNWGQCMSNGSQRRRATSACVGGNPLVSQACSYSKNFRSGQIKVQRGSGDTRQVNVRNAPNGAIIFKVSNGAVGTVSNRQFVSNFWRIKVNFGSLGEGWIMEDYAVRP